MRKMMLSWAVMVELLLMFVVMTLNTNRFCCPTAPRPHCCVILSLFCRRLAVQQRSLPARPASPPGCPEIIPHSAASRTRAILRRRTQHGRACASSPPARLTLTAGSFGTDGVAAGALQTGDHQEPQWGQQGREYWEHKEYGNKGEQGEY